MKRDRLDEQLEKIRDIKAPPYLTEKIMHQIKQNNEEKTLSIQSIYKINIRRLGISMIATALLMFITLCIPTEETDIFHHTVQAQTQAITKHTNKAYNYIYNPIQEVNETLKKLYKEIKIIKEELSNGMYKTSR